MNALPRHLLVPVDGSDGSMHAAATAGALAAALGARITLLYVVPATSAEAMGMRGSSREEIERRLDQAAAPVFEKVAAVLAGVEGLPPHSQAVRFGVPADEILAAVDRLAVDHIVMGSRGLSHMEELLLGSVSEKVVRRATCPVTVMR